MTSKTACLVLENGAHFSGIAAGRLNHKAFGEIVFNTGLSGYQEILTDASYAGQIITLTYPEIGNYGISSADYQAPCSFAKGLVVKNLSFTHSSWRADLGSLNEFLLAQNLSAIVGIDTRALTLMIREKGAMRAVLSTESNYSVTDLLKEVRASSSLQGQNLAATVSTNVAYRLPSSNQMVKGKIVVLDFGLKRRMLQILNNLGFDLIVMPHSTNINQIVSEKPVGIFLSNGPGDPSACTEAITTLKKLIEINIAPIFGVCLGHQILATSLGGETFKLKFGHRGSNHPVKDLETGRILITSQNHGFAVRESSLDLSQLTVSHRSLNDQTVEGFAHMHQPIFSVQFHPEASPGPQDTEYLFHKFTNLIETYQLSKTGI